MSEDNNNQVRRFGRRNQKDKLQKPKSLFPIEDDDPITDDKSIEADDVAPSESAEFDMDSLNLPDTDSQAVQMLSSLRDEVKAPVITPSAERYPPLAPSAVDPIETQSDDVTIDETPKYKNAWFYNVVSLFLIAAAIFNTVWFVIVWNDPQSAWNPLPPETPFMIIQVTPDSEAQIDNLPTPDDQGQIFVVITDTPAPTIEGTESPFPFVAEPILYAPNSNELECNWWSIAGTVTDFDGNPISGYRIRIIGQDIDETVFSGASQAFGDGGYELPLVGTPQEVTFTAQLLTAQDVPLSEPVTVETRSDCDANVAVINFIQNR